MKFNLNRPLLEKAAATAHLGMTLDNISSPILFSNENILREINITNPPLRRGPDLYKTLGDKLIALNKEAEELILQLRTQLMNPGDPNTPVEGELIARLQYLEQMLKETRDQLQLSEEDRRALVAENGRLKCQLETVELEAIEGINMAERKLVEAQESSYRLTRELKDLQRELETSHSLNQGMNAQLHTATDQLVEMKQRHEHEILTFKSATADSEERLEAFSKQYRETQRLESIRHRAFTKWLSHSGVNILPCFEPYLPDFIWPPPPPQPGEGEPELPSPPGAQQASPPASPSPDVASNTTSGTSGSSSADSLNQGEGMEEN